MNILFLVKLKRGGRPFLEGASIDLSSSLSLTYWGSSSFYSLSVRVYSLFGQIEGKRRIFFEECKDGGGHSMRLPQEHLVVIRDEKNIFFCEIQNNSPLVCYLLNPLTNKYSRAWSSMINFADRFKDLPNESRCNY